MSQPRTEIRKRIPIRKRLMATVLLTAILSIMAVSITGLLCIRWIRSSTEVTLTEQLEINLRNTIKQKVSSMDARMEHYERYLEFYSDYIDYMYDNKGEMIKNGRMIYPPTNTHEYELTRAFASPDLTEKDLKNEILFFSNLEKIWEPIAKENDGLITTTYLGTTDGLMVSYDKYSYLTCPPPGKEVVYNYYVTEWYKRGIKEDGVITTGVYMDFQGRGLTITIGCGFRDEEGEPAGVVCMDFDLAALYDNLFSTDLEDGTFTFALDHEGTIISPDSDIINIESYTGLTLDELDELRSDPDGIMEKGDSVYVCIPSDRLGWTLCARVPKQAIQDSIHDADQSIWHAMIVFFAVVVLIMLIVVYVVNRTVRDVTYPLELLEKDIRIITDGNLNYRASVYRNDEIGDITSGMNAMVDRLNFTLNELLSSQQHADAMSRLATLDSLTGIRNKTAFDEQSKLLSEEIRSGDAEFGLALVDLNNLKLINDNYGHEKGDIAIKTLCGIICDVFTETNVFRVGGDEFVILLKDEDYSNAEALVDQFKERMRNVAFDYTLQPWIRVSAAIGYALYNSSTDSGTDSVFARADHEMYSCKKMMKEGHLTY